MRLFLVINIQEFYTKFFGFSVSNRLLCAIFSIVQIIFVVASFLQHVYSWVNYSHVFYCRSAIGPHPTWEQRFLAYDLVIFDFGLMHRVLGTTECVANYLDGALFMQSSYVLGMAILTMATAPKLLEALGGLADPELNTSFLIYAIGFSLNWLFTFILWHYYWGIESRYGKHTNDLKKEILQPNIYKNPMFEQTNV